MMVMVVLDKVCVECYVRPVLEKLFFKFSIFF